MASPIYIYALKHDKRLSDFNQMFDQQSGTHNGYLILSYEHPFVQKMKDELHIKEKSNYFQLSGKYDVANEFLEKTDLKLQREFTYCESYNQFINHINNKIDSYEFNDEELQELKELESLLSNDIDDYLVIGFDTLHVYDNKGNSNTEKVVDDLNKIREFMNS